MVLFEIAQASIRNWRPLENSLQKRWSRISLEVHVEIGDKRGCRCCRRKDASTKARVRTGAVEEANEMCWRTCNEDGFLVELCTVCELRVHARRGDVLPLVVSVIRTQDSCVKGNVVISLRGELHFGAWGRVSLLPGDKDMALEAALEVRPVSSRPFVLENAQLLEERTLAEARLGLGRVGAPAARIAASGSHFTAPLSAMRRSLGLRGGLDETERSRAATQLVRGSARESFVAPQWNSESEANGPSTLLGKLLSRVPGCKPVEGLDGACRQWHPDDWSALWHLPPGGSTSSVVVLMETEFRRDAIVLFNTLFPQLSLHGPSIVMLSRRRSSASLVGDVRPQMSTLQQTVNSAKPWIPGACQVNNTFDLLKEHSGDAMQPTTSTGGTPTQSLSNTPILLHMVREGTWSRSSLGEGVNEDYARRIMLLKRLFMCCALSGVHYSEVGNSSQTGDTWPYPLAAVLGHGSRLLIRLEDVDSSDFVNFLLTGDRKSSSWKESGIPRPLQRRLAATHTVELTANGQTIERKLHVLNAADSVQNISDGLKKKHLGLDLPIGGVGSPSPMGKEHFVGFRGEVWRGGKQRRRPFQLLAQEGSSRPGPSSANAGVGGAKSGDVDVWRTVPDVQSGHLYMRLDDFGEVVSASVNIPVSQKRVRCAATRQVLLGRKKDVIAFEQAQMQERLRCQSSPAGDLHLHVRGVAPLPLRARQGTSALMGSDTTGDIRLLRVRSAPCLRLGDDSDTPVASEDVRWARSAILSTSHQPLPAPPSPAALRLLLEHYDPANSQLFGRGRFKSLFEFFMELKRKTSFLVKSETGGLQRYCEPVLLQVCWKGHVLMKMKELPPGRSSPLPKNSFIATRLMPREDWRAAAMRILESDLHFDEQAFVAMLQEQDSDGCHTLIRETTVSPSYPGLLSTYCTHMVRWEISENCPWPCEHADRSFVTTSTTEEGCKTLFWRWVPIMEAQKLQRFINMSEATADEQWAKYAFQKEGLVQCPPTETALQTLLRRCGVDVASFGTGPGSRLGDLWRALTTSDCSLQMNSGRPVQVLDDLVLKLCWSLPTPQPEASGNPSPSSPGHHKVLVQVVSDHTSDTLTRSLLTGQKRREEKWEDAAMRCLEMATDLTRQEVKAMLLDKDKVDGEEPQCMFYEETKESITYPGIQCLYRTHLVNWKMKDEMSLLPAVGSTASRQSEPTAASKRLGSLRSKLARSTSSKRGQTTDHHSNEKAAAAQQADCELEWLDESLLSGVHGADLWDRVTGLRERHHVSSVLVGLEGSAPNMRSPFGVEHTASGTSASISALGNSKWRDYRKRGALQVPADFGGLHLRVTEASMKEFEKACRDVGLVDPSLELGPRAAHPRGLLERRFAERQLFKRILSGNGKQARAAVESVRSYWASRRDVM